MEIKHERFATEELRENVRAELERLVPLIEPLLKREEAIPKLKARLRTVNERLWDIENRIRQKEAHAKFDDEFVALARSVYTGNDERSAIKKMINGFLGCTVQEQKHYS